MFALDSDVAFASHHRPTWGRENIVAYLTEQRDLYAYLHDQTLRLINQGYVHSGSRRCWNYRRRSTRRGTPTVTTARSTTTRRRSLGGIDATVAKATEYAAKDDLRFAAELASHAVFAQPDHQGARTLLADTLEKLGWGSENATWRNCFLTGAQELRDAKIGHTDLNSAGMAPAFTITQLFDAVGIRIVGSKAWDLALTINWIFTDSGESYWMELSHGALIHYPTTAKHDAQLTVTLTKPQLLGMLASGSPEGIEMSGDPSVLVQLMGVTDNDDPDFAVVTP